MLEITKDIIVHTVDKGEVMLSSLSQSELQVLANDPHFKQFIKKRGIKKTEEANNI